MKFDETYPYGDAQDAFKEATKSLTTHENIIVAEVHVAGTFTFNICLPYFINYMYTMIK